MNYPTRQLKTYFSAARLNALAWTGLVFVCLLLAWWQLGWWYQDRLLVEERAEVAIELAPYSNALTQSINRRFAILDGLAAFVHSELDSHGMISEQDFENFANGMSITVEGVRGLSIAPDAVQQFVFPRAENEAIIGMNLLDGARPDVTEDVQRSIRLRQITLSGPYPSRDGATWVLVARLAVFRDDQFWGLVTMTLDVPPLLAEAGLESQLSGLTAALRDSDGQVFQGAEAVFDAEPVAFSLELPEGRWELAAVPTEGWQHAIRPYLFIAHGSGLTVVILVSGLVYLTAHRQQRLSDGIAQRTRALHEREERLRETMAQLEGIKRHSPDLMTLVDRAGRYLMVNQSAAQLLGHSPEAVVGKAFADLLPSEVAGTFMHRIETVLETKQPLQIKDQMPQATVYETTLFPLFDQAGDCYAVGGIARDVTEQLQMEETLRESLDQLNAIIEASPLTIISLTVEGTVTTWNAGAEQMFGWTAEEAIGRMPPFISPENQDQFRRLHRRVMQGESLSSIEISRQRKDGSLVELSLSTAPLRDAEGRITGIMSILEDITQRVQAQEALRESEKRFRAIFEVASVGIVQVDTRDGQLIRCNQTFCEITGYTEDDLRTMTFPELTHPEDRQRDWALFSAAVRGEIPIYTNEKRYVRKDGSIIWVRLNAGFIRDAAGQPIRTVAVCEDITERVVADKEREHLLAQIHDQARQLRDVMSTVPEGVVLLDTGGRVLLANPVAERHIAFLSDAQSDLITHLGNRTLAELLTSPPRGMWHEIQEGTRTFEVIARPVANGPEPEKWVLVIQDVTEERTIRRRTDLQERLASVGQLAAGIAHDFNNLIAVIALYAQMGARDTDLPPRHKERSSIILEQTQRAKELVQQVLDFSRRAALDLQPMDLLLFMKEQVHLLKRTIPEDIDIRLDYRHNEYLVNADPTRMQQVVMNLAVNARDAMPHGGRLDIELEDVQVEAPKSAPLPGMTAGHWVRMTMRDTGEGIPSDVLPHIFEPFFTTKAAGEGTGLGLAQVWGILKQHDGLIDVESEIGLGTTFSLYLPAITTQHAEHSPIITEDLPQGEGQIILVVEDNAALRAALTESLETVNYRVLEAANGHAALDVLGQHAGEISLILSDLVMPGMGGQALFYAMEEQNLTIPMIMMSGHPMESELKRLQEHGLAGWMLKPPDMGRLLRLVARALRVVPWC